MNITTVGTRVAGNLVAYELWQQHYLSVYESGDYFGGHTATMDVYENGRKFAVDTEFVVLDDRTYPNFVHLLDEIRQESQPSEMKFSVQAGYGRLKYSGSSLNAMFTERSNIVRPPFYRTL